MRTPDCLILENGSVLPVSDHAKKVLAESHWFSKSDNGAYANIDKRYTEFDLSITYRMTFWKRDSDEIHSITEEETAAFDNYDPTP